MYPILFSIQDFYVYSLGTFLVLGFIVFNIVVMRLAWHKKLNIKFWNSHIISLSIATILGARAMYIIPHIERFQSDWSQIFIPDGFSFYGGALAFTLLLYFQTKKTKEDFLGWLDIFAVAFFGWLFFSAIGHFLDGSNFGTPTDLPWGVTYDSIMSPVTYTVPIHPTQLYQALWALGLFILLWTLITITRRKGVIAILGGFLLGTFNFFTNYLMGDNTLMIGAFRFDQIIDLLFVAICGGILLSFFVMKQEK